MSKRNLHSVKKDYEDTVEKPVEKVEAKVFASSTKKIQLLVDAKLKATGYVTGNSYVFNGAGSVVDVDERDVEQLLEKRQGGRQCCGGTGVGNAVFSLAEVT